MSIPSLAGERLPAIRRECARELLAMYKKANAGHIGASLSCLEILVDLCFSRMASDDRLILSKGHAALALYITLARSGRMDAAELDTFYRDGTRLGAHPPTAGQIESIPFGTDSLGHGLSLAAGLALSQQFTGKRFRVFCVLSDGDCNEGSTWEAALFAAQHKLDNLTVIVDANGIQGFGRTSAVLNMEPLEEKWRSFGFETETAACGNDFECLRLGYSKLESRSSSGPRCLVARTTKGNGISYMRDTVAWHYWPMNDEQYRLALEELQGSQNSSRE